jgi:hypothetical protein
MERRRAVDFNMHVFLPSSLNVPLPFQPQQHVVDQSYPQLEQLTRTPRSSLRHQYRSNLGVIGSSATATPSCYPIMTDMMYASCFSSRRLTWVPILEFRPNGPFNRFCISNFRRKRHLFGSKSAKDLLELILQP